MHGPLRERIFDNMRVPKAIELDTIRMREQNIDVAGWREHMNALWILECTSR